MRTQFSLLVGLTSNYGHTICAINLCMLMMVIELRCLDAFATKWNEDAMPIVGNYNIISFTWTPRVGAWRIDVIVMSFPIPGIPIMEVMHNNVKIMHSHELKEWRVIIQEHCYIMGTWRRIQDHLRHLGKALGTFSKCIMACHESLFMGHKWLDTRCLLCKINVDCNRNGQQNKEKDYSRK